MMPLKLRAKNTVPVQIRLPREDAPWMSYERPTRNRDKHMTEVDPMEMKNVYIKTLPEMGDGAFAKRDFEVGEIVSYFGGYLINMTEFPLTWSNMSVIEM